MQTDLAILCGCMELQAPQIVDYASLSVDFTPYDTRWIPSSARFIAVGMKARGTGVINAYEIDKGKIKCAQQIERKEGVKCCTFGASQYESRHVAVGDYSGVLSVWDLARPDKPTFEAKAHSTMVNCVDGCGGLNIGYGAPELATGARDGCVRVFDLRQNTPVSSLVPAKGQTTIRDCWAVAFGNSFNDNDRLLAAGFDNGDLKMIDLRVNKLVYETNVKNGITCLEFDRRDIQMNKLLMTLLESRFQVFDMRTLHPESGYASLVQKAQTGTVWVGRHLPQNRDVFMTCGGNGTANLYQYHYPNQRRIKDTEGREQGVIGSVSLLSSRKFGEQPVTSFDWSPDKQGLCVLSSLDTQLRVALVTKLSKLS